MFKAARIIQKHTKTFICRKKYLKILIGEKCFNSVQWKDKGKEVYLISNFTSPPWQKKIRLDYCPLRKIFVKYFKDLKEGNYLIKYEVDGEYKCSSKIPTIVDKYGNFNNLLSISENKDSHYFFKQTQYHTQPTKSSKSSKSKWKKKLSENWSKVLKSQISESKWKTEKSKKKPNFLKRISKKGEKDISKAKVEKSTKRRINFKEEEFKDLREKHCDKSLSPSPKLLSPSISTPELDRTPKTERPMTLKPMQVPMLNMKSILLSPSNPPHLTLSNSYDTSHQTLTSSTDLNQAFILNAKNTNWSKCTNASIQYEGLDKNADPPYAHHLEFMNCPTTASSVTSSRPTLQLHANTHTLIDFSLSPFSHTYYQ